MQVHQEIDGIPVGAACEAVIKALPRNDVHRRFRVFVERTKTDKLVTLGIKPNLFGDQGDDIGGLKDPVSVICSRGRGHGRRNPKRRRGGKGRLETGDKEQPHTFDAETAPFALDRTEAGSSRHRTHATNRHANF